MGSTSEEKEKMRIVEVTLVFSSPQPLIIVANKCDVKKISELSEENQVTFRYSRTYLYEILDVFLTLTRCSVTSDPQKVFTQLSAEGISVIETSTLTEEGVMQVKNEVRRQASVCCSVSLFLLSLLSDAAALSRPATGS